MEEASPFLRRKLIEVALPLDAINEAAAHEKMPGIGAHPRGLHQWWARRPLSAARAVLFAQLVDDPADWPERFPTKTEQNAERERLFGILRKLVQWKNTTDEGVLEAARAEIRESWRRNRAESAQGEELPPFFDPFAGGGAIPLEAQRLGLAARAADLNPVAVLITKTMIEIPPRFAGTPPVNPDWQQRSGQQTTPRSFPGASGLAADVRFYGAWMRDEARRRLGHLYPEARISPELLQGRPDLARYAGATAKGPGKERGTEGGRELPVIAWLWARTVKSPNPAFAEVEVPLVSSFLLSSKKKGKQAWVEPEVSGREYRFEVRTGSPPETETVKRGTKLGRGANFRCLVSGVPIPPEYIKAEGKAGRLGVRLMAVVAAGDRERVYLPPTPEHEAAALRARPAWKPHGEVPPRLTGGTCVPYGMKEWGDLFTERQLAALTTFSDLVAEARVRMREDALAASLTEDGLPLREGGSGPRAYADAVSVYLAFALDRCADFSNSCTRWVPGNQKVMNLFGKQAIPMTWDFPEAAILHDTVGGFAPATRFIADCLALLPSKPSVGTAEQRDAAAPPSPEDRIVSTDPPYYDNVAYADLSDFFYVWLRRTLRPVFPELFATLATPKDEELVAAPHRHGGRTGTEAFFLDGMRRALERLAEQAHPAFPVTLYYAFKQAETKGEGATVRTGWETFLEAVIGAGFSITGTWPIRTEQKHRMVGMGTNALASSVVLACRRRPAGTAPATRRQFAAALRRELPEALAPLRRAHIAPVDLAQAAIGPGMAIFTRTPQVLEAGGRPVAVGEALAQINEVLGETLSELTGEYDAETRWAAEWYEQYGFGTGEYGEAETLSKARNTSVSGLVEAGIVRSGGGRVRLLRPEELGESRERGEAWAPEGEGRLTGWRVAHELVRAREQGEVAAGRLLRRLTGRVEGVRELLYGLHAAAERRGRAGEAFAYDALVRSWPEIERLARENPREPKPLL